MAPSQHRVLFLQIVISVCQAHMKFFNFLLFFFFAFAWTFLTPYEFVSTCSSTKGLNCRIISVSFLCPLCDMLFMKIWTLWAKYCGFWSTSAASNTHALILFPQSYLEIYLHWQLIYIDCTSSLPASCLVFICFFLLLVFSSVFLCCRRNTPRQ